jgi:hypothetical protein
MLRFLNDGTTGIHYVSACVCVRVCEYIHNTYSVYRKCIHDYRRLSVFTCTHTTRFVEVCDLKLQVHEDL